MMEEEEKPIALEDGEESSSDDASASESDAELMVTTRTRRITAGNRYGALVAQEELIAEDEDDEVAMLFAEEEGEDEDFNSDEGDEDADMSSSDDDDQGPNTAAGDMEGEADLQKEVKLERAKKRKADLALTTMAGISKKPKIDPTSLRRTSAAKPLKRKERVSWLPGSSVAPGRTSLRKQTIIHRAETHAKLKENEAHRLKMKAKREKREREREAEAPKELTQADRLAEAERVERRNAKSLNRWEAMEKKRTEEQAARLAALKERKLEGAVITWYSSPGKYLGLKPEKEEIENEPPPGAKKRGRKPKALLEQLAAAKLASESALADPSQVQSSISAPSSDQIASASISQPPPPPPSTVRASQIVQNPEHSPSSATPDVPEPQSAPAPDKSSNNSFLDGIHTYASMQTESSHAGQSTRSETAAEVGNPGGQSTLKKPLDDVSDNLSTLELATDSKKGSDAPDLVREEHVGTNQESPKPVPPKQSILEASPPPPVEAAHNDVPNAEDIKMTGIDNAIADGDSLKTKTPDVAQLSLQGNEDQRLSTMAEMPQHTAAMSTSTNANSTPAVSSPSEPPIEVISTRNLVILDKFNDLSDQAKYDYSMFHNNRKPVKLVKHTQEMCPVSGLPARYRDPASGIAYANSSAYKKLQELRGQKFTWSSMLGCYVGRADVVARGVPEGFLGS